MAEPERYFFIHLLKTGGTDLFTRLGGDRSLTLDHPYTFAEAEIYPNATDGSVFTVGPQIDVDTLLDRWALRGDEIRIVMGHLPYCTIDLLDVPFTTLTVLRDPVERTLSFLRYHRKVTPDDRDTPLEALYDEPTRFRTLIHNHMVKMFSLTAESARSGLLAEVDFTPEHLARARTNLAAVDVVGLQEDYETFCTQLEARFGWVLGKPLHSMHTEPEPVDGAFRRRIAEDNALDVEFYEFARALYADRAASAAS